MPDSNGRNGGGGWGTGPRQSVVEHVGGWDDIVIAIRDTLLLALLAALNVVLLLVLTLLAGPWALVVFVPGVTNRVYHWVYDADAWYRDTLVLIGTATLGVLLLVPDAALIWWPWRWQATRESWWGLLWPGWWERAIPAVVTVRAVVAAGLVAGWREVWYLTQRLRQEVVAPTLSSVAYVAPAPHLVDIDGYANPYRDPTPPEEQEPSREIVRAFAVENVPAERSPALALSDSVMVGESNGNGGAGRYRNLEIPVKLLGDDDETALRRIRAIAYGTLEDGRPWSRPEWTAHDFMTGHEWRRLNAWLVAHGLVVKAGEQHNAPHEWQRGGRFWLGAFIRDDEE